MADLLKMYLDRELPKRVQEQYPHLQYPGCVYALVTGVRNQVCTIKILDKNRVQDKRFPEIPGVRTELELTAGDIVVVLLLYGECRPYIVGRCL